MYIPASPRDANTRILYTAINDLSRPLRQPCRAPWPCYPLPMAIDVKKPQGKTRRGTGRSRVSGKHQITIPIGAFTEAGLREGDVVRVEAQGRGRVLIARMDDLIDEYAGCLHTGGELGRTVRGLRQEWD
jgi:bifunctional DNA-binding transcriptional regulator/antitoxin component of YhaV-PrlF toxin-antitoxin module